MQTKRAGMRLGRYMLKERIARGQWSWVYQAYDVASSKEVIVKTVPPTAPVDLVGLIEDAIRGEYAALTRCSHPSIVRLLDFVDGPGRPYLVLEFVRGMELRQAIKCGLSIERSMAIAIELADALQHVHSQGIVHGDLKPGNVMVRSQGLESSSVALIDFGLAIQNLREGQFAGTPEYVAPEQIRGKVCAATDIYSFGVLLFHMLTGKVPYANEDPLRVLADHLQREIPRAAEHCDRAIPRELDAIVARCMQKNPSDRFSSAAALRAALQAAASKLEGETRSVVAA